MHGCRRSRRRAARARPRRSISTRRADTVARLRGHAAAGRVTLTVRRHVPRVRSTRHERPQVRRARRRDHPRVTTTSVDDAVASAHEGLADAEAARATSSCDEPVVAESRSSLTSRSSRTSTRRMPAPTPPTEPWSPRPWSPRRRRPPRSGYYDAEPVDETYTPGRVLERPRRPDRGRRARRGRGRGDAAAAAAPQPIFVQAPEAPRPRGNRAAAGAIGLLAALAFGVLYLAAALGLRAVDGDVTSLERRRRVAGRADVVVVLGARRRVLPRVLAARRDHQPRPLGPLGHLRPARGCRLVRRPHPRPALPGAVLVADGESGRRTRPRTRCSLRWRSSPSCSVAS